MAPGRNAGVDIRRYALLSSLTLVTGGCDRGDFASGSVAVRDSAGVTIVENRSSDAATLAWFVDDTPVMDLGRAEGDGADVFGYVRPVIRLRTGNLAVADAGAHEIRVFYYVLNGREGRARGAQVASWGTQQNRNAVGQRVLARGEENGCGIHHHEHSNSSGLPCCDDALEFVYIGRTCMAVPGAPQPG
jgi:hypothetical protein